ncbi:MAG: hypothetical protein WAV20_02210 [Blastocatellia bacterium]
MNYNIAKKLRISIANAIRLRRIPRPLTTIVAVSVCFALTAFVARTSDQARVNPAAVIDGMPSTSSFSPKPNAQPTARIQVETITIRRTGIEPTEITRPAGRFLLAVYKRSGQDEVSLRLDRIGGNRLRDVRVARETLDWRTVEDLNPGNYVLTEANHPGWACRITITPK